MGWPITSASVKPKSAVAALFHDRILPSASPEMIASIADSMTDRNLASDSRRAIRTFGDRDLALDVPPELALLDLDEKAERIGVPQMGVHQQEVGFGPGDGFDDVGAAGRVLHGVPVLLQELLQSLDAGFVVVDDQDKSTVGHSLILLVSSAHYVDCSSVYPRSVLLRERHIRRRRPTLAAHSRSGRSSRLQ